MRNKRANGIKIRSIPTGRKLLFADVLILCLAFTFSSFSLLYGGQREGLKAGDCSDYSDTEIVNAIGKAENSKKYPYGIKSIDTKGNAEYARKICFNSVRNGRKRWEQAGKPDDLITFISRRYCPINAPDDNGTNKFWVKNVKGFLVQHGN